MNSLEARLIVLTLVSFLLIPIPYTVNAKSRAVLDMHKQGSDQYYSGVLDACTPYPYHSHENVTDVIHSQINASKTENQSMGCAWELSSMKDGCQEIPVKSCSDPRFTNFLVNVYGTPAFEQAFATQKAAVIAHSEQELSHHQGIAPPPPPLSSNSNNTTKRLPLSNATALLPPPITRLLNLTTVVNGQVLEYRSFPCPDNPGVVCSGFYPVANKTIMKNGGMIIIPRKPVMPPPPPLITP